MYHLVYGILYLVSLLPLSVLYLIADLVYVLIYYVVGYRKKIVIGNLNRAFPDKSKEEITIIAKKFYHNLADSFVETLKLISASDRFIKTHMTGDFSIFEKLYAEGKRCQIHSSHNFNWEFANVVIPLEIPHTLLTVYMPLNNKIFERIFYKFRAKTGAVLLPATDMRAAILPHRKSLYALALVADQNAGNPTSGWWINFFGKPAPFVKAPESGARRGNIPVVFSYFTKESRGKYTIHFSLAEETPANTREGELTVKYVRFLEEVIRKHPDVWLWSHRRWKWEWKPEYGEIVDGQ